MQTLEYDHNDFQSGAQSQLDAQMLVRFELRAVPDKAATAREGRPIFKDVEYISIRAPGQKDAVTKPCRAKEINRFRRQYDQWKATNEQPVLEGTPLSEWPQVRASQVEELKFLNIRTVEDMAAMADNLVGQIMGGNTLKRKAQEFLATSKEGRDKAELLAELETRDEIIAKQGAMLQELQEKVEAMDKPKPKRKRRTKAEIEADKAGES